MHNSPRRLLLRVGVKLMFLVAAAVSAFILFSSGEKQPSLTKQTSPLHISPGNLTTDGLQRIPWQSGNLILLRHSPAVHAQLGNHDRQLHNPVPPNLAAGIYVAFDRGGGMGCPLRWVPPATTVDSAPLQPWPGGLRDTCDGSWYDAAGRVFRGQATTDNLQSPSYHLTGELLEIGAYGDNPLPAK